MINTIHAENQNIRPPKKDYLESNISNGNFRNNNSYYKGSKPFNSAQNLSGGNRYKKEKEFIEEEVVKPQFINSQLDNDVHFQDLKQDDDLFYKKMQKLQVKETEEKPKEEEKPIEQNEEDNNEQYYTSQTEGNYYNNNYNTQRYRKNYYYNNQRGNYNNNYRYNSYRRNYNNDYQNEEELIAQTLGNEEEDYEKKENKVNRKKKIRPPKEEEKAETKTSSGKVIIKIDSVSLYYIIKYRKRNV